MNGDTANNLSHALRWALESGTDPAMASANWLAQEIDPQHAGAVALLADRDITLARLMDAKDAFKTMRVLGETSGDRRLAARLYLGAIAAAISYHGVRISGQSADSVIGRLEDMIEDPDAPAELRHIAGEARERIDQDGWSNMPRRATG
ncbi:MAG: hypothetical protein AAF432_03585 [Planctomycetota bacterium]